MRKMIVLPIGEITKLAKRFSTSRVTVYRALRYMNNSDLSKKIRHAAVSDLGGEVFVKVEEKRD